MPRALRTASWEVSVRGMRFVSGEVASAAFSAWVKGAKGDCNDLLQLPALSCSHGLNRSWES